MVESNPFEVDADADGPDAAMAGFRKSVVLLEEIRAKKAAAEAIVEETQDAIERMLTGTLAKMMHELGVDSVGLSTGEKLKLQPFVTCSIRKGREEGAFGWLRANEHGGIVRETVTLSVPEERAEDAVEVAKTLVEAGWEVSSKKAIHAATLKSWAAEMAEKGEKVPTEFFNSSSVDRVNIRNR